MGRVLKSLPREAPLHHLDPANAVMSPDLFLGVGSRGFRQAP